MKYFYGSNQVGRLRIPGRRKRSSVRRKVHRKPGHDGHKARNAPATQNGRTHSGRHQPLAWSERQFVNDALHERMRPVKVVPSVISSWIYVEGKAAVIADLKTHAFCECIRGGGRKTVGEFPVKF